jgi:hypothetical protein
MNLQRMDEWALLEHAAKALFAAVCMPVGSVERTLLWATYDYYMEELRFRAGRVIMARMNTR